MYFVVRVDYIYQLCSQYQSMRVIITKSVVFIKSILHNEVGTNNLQFLNVKLKLMAGQLGLKVRVDDWQDREGFSRSLIWSNNMH